MQPFITQAGRGNERNPQPLHAVQLADALLRIQTVANATGLSGATIYRRLKAGEFPKPVRMGARCTRWKATQGRGPAARWMAAAQGDAPDDA